MKIDVIEVEKFSSQLRQVSARVHATESTSKERLTVKPNHNRHFALVLRDGQVARVYVQAQAVFGTQHSVAVKKP